jgi:glycerate kinase
LGDSATNDGGVGMAQPLGFKFYDKLGRELPIGRFSIEKIHYIKFPNLDKKVKFIGLCDGNYTLCGKEGISKISVLNKGGKLSDARKLENEMRHLNKLFKIYFGKDFSKIKKSGCAGGLAAGLSAFLDAKLVLGAKFIIDKFHLRKIIKNQDLIIVGEGEINFQTVNGKAVYIISKMAKRYGIPVVAFTGRLGKGFSKLYNYGVKKILVTDPQQIPFEQVKKKGLGVKYIENKARELGQELNKVV